MGEHKSLFVRKCCGKSEEQFDNFIETVDKLIVKHVKIKIKAITRALTLSLFMFLVDLLPNSVRARIKKKKADKLGLKMKSDEIPKQFGGWQQFKTIYNTTLQQSNVTLKVGDPVPAITLTNLETGKKSTLQSLMRSNVPLVLNFGSCT